MAVPASNLRMVSFSLEIQRHMIDSKAPRNNLVQGLLQFIRMIVVTSGKPQLSLGIWALRLPKHLYLVNKE